MNKHFFSPDYATARKRFREAAQKAGCALEPHPIGLTGPQGEELSIDIALSEAMDGAHAPCLVISSGVHGVEGYFGSAVQLAVLEQWRANPALAPRCRWVMIHAVNPYGMAWRRRVNEDNADLNRNFLLAGQSYAGSPEGYAKLDGLINPQGAPAFFEPDRLKLAAAILRHGKPVIQQAVSGGQYDYPKGLFFGGAKATRSKDILEAHYDRWLGGASSIMHVDFHTGLGASGDYKMLVDHPLDAAQQQRLETTFGVDKVQTMGPGGISSTLRGTFGIWGHSRHKAGEYIYTAAEYGTYSVLDMLAALRAENRAVHWGAPGDARTEKAKRALLEAFCPASERWRGQVIDSGVRVVSQAVGALS